jgi:hypothetical protein
MFSAAGGAGGFRLLRFVGRIEKFEGYGCGNHRAGRRKGGGSGK